MTNKSEDQFDAFIDTMAEELMAMPDEQVLEGLDAATVQADGLRLLQAAKAKAGRARLAAARAGVMAASAHPKRAASLVTPEAARQFIARSANDGRYTLAARSLGDMSDDEIIRLYNQLKSLESGADGADK